ncbi:hypothetical protein KCU59_g19375, partial [Aureobasidium melanogenum]
LPLSSLAAVLLYQGTNPALYYLIGCGVYFWAYTDGGLREALDVTAKTKPSEAIRTDMT